MGFVIVNLIILNKKAWEMTKDFSFVNRKFLSRKDFPFTMYSHQKRYMYLIFFIKIGGNIERIYPTRDNKSSFCERNVRFLYFGRRYLIYKNMFNFLKRLS